MGDDVFVLHPGAAAAEAWVETVAELLPWPFRAPAPFTLCEAVEELGAWARSARGDAWSRKENFRSLVDDVIASRELLGPRMRAATDESVHILTTASDRTLIAKAAAALGERWRESAIVLAAFEDLCDAARDLTSTSRRLRPLAAVLASQTREGVAGGWSVLRQVVTALVEDPVEAELAAWFGPDASLDTLTLEDRLAAARTVLTRALPTGEVVVWLVYDRALIPIRVEAGAVTLHRAEWAAPNAHNDDGQEFDDRDELREVLASAMWGDTVLEAVRAVDSRIVLARIALGRRQPVGAVAEATRRVEALLSIAVGSGGVSWRSTGSSAVLLDGRVISESFGRALRSDQPAGGADSYGIGVTSQALLYAAGELTSALARGPMPDFLVEALLALREAAMTDHRDVVFYGQRAVTPRVAIALEDHAIEAIASYGAMSQGELADALEIRQAEESFVQHLLRAFMAPLDEVWREADGPERRDLERIVAQRDNGRRVVSIPEIDRQRARFDRLEMAPFTRADLDEAFRAVHDPAVEGALRASIGAEVALLRRRHRRVRNAIAHGSPITPSALDSVREVASDMAQEALEIALGAFAHEDTVQGILQRGADQHRRDEAGLAAGRSYLERHDT